MKNIVPILLLFVLLTTSIYSQNKISFSSGVGYNLSNTENSLLITGDKRYKFFVPISVSYQRNNFCGYDLRIEYTFRQSTKVDVLKFVRTGENDPTPISTFGADILLINHNLDFNYVGNFSEYFNYGYGFSFVITNRIFEVEDIIYDKLASSGIGVNGFLELEVPFNEEKEHLFFFAKLKFRYTHSIWFDEGIRILDNYYQEFLVSQLTVGLGYSF